MSVLVTGMHRSGTSAVARLIDAFGVSTGTGPTMPATHENPHGFFERTDVAAFNDDWLARLGGSWWAPPHTTAATWAWIDEALLADARSRLDLFDADAPAWYSKDPRLALLLPLWDRILLRHLPVVWCVRAPSEVALSLYLRNGFSKRRGLALWAAYVGAAANHLGRRPTLVLDHAALLENPGAAIDALDAFLRDCGHEPAASWDRHTAEALIERRLHRAEPSGDDGTLAAEHEGLHGVYRTLARRHGDVVRGVPAAPVPPWAEEVVDELRELHRVTAARDACERQLRIVAARPALGDDAQPAQAALRADHDALSRQFHALQEEHGTIQARCRELSAEIEALRAERTEVLAAVRAAQRTVEVERERAQQALAADRAAWSRQLHELQEARAADQARCRDLSAELETLRAERTELVAVVREAQRAVEAERERAQQARAADQATLSRQLRELQEEHAADQARCRDLSAEIEGLRAERTELVAAVHEAQRAVDIELERAQLAEQQVRALEAAVATALRAASPPAPGADPPPETGTPAHLDAAARDIERLEARLVTLEAQLEHRRVAMADMSRELERRRSRTHRAEVTIAELEPRAAALSPLENEMRALRHELLVVAFERDNYREALVGSVARHVEVATRLDNVLASPTFRLSRVLVAPGRLVRRAGRRSR